MQVLRPQSQVSTLEVWGFYLGEELCHGPSYDLEVVQQDAAAAEEEKAAAGPPNDSTLVAGKAAIARKLVTTG